MISRKKNRGAPISEASARLKEQTEFTAREAYKIIRTNLLFTLASAPRHVVLVTSAESAAGKSLTCANLAISMAQTDKKVIVVDADMRKPAQHRIFELANQDGLSTILSGSAKLEGAVTHYKETTLDIMTAGPIPPNPAELLGSKPMAELLDTLEQRYEYVFIDTPPINILSDGLILVSKAGGAVLVARQGQTTYGALQKAADSIQQVNGNVLGAIVNDVREKNKPYGSYYYNNYYDSSDNKGGK